MPAPTLPQHVTIRPLAATDSISELTALLHRAYAPLAERGMEYLATHQDDDTTRCRTAEGECFVAVHDDGRIVGTIVLIPAHGPGDVPYYDRPDVACFGQFAVEPALQGAGIGARLMDTVERRAAETGAREIALDTAETAVELIATYTRRGYRVVAGADWDVTNYRSVIMSRALAAPA